MWAGMGVCLGTNSIALRVRVRCLQCQGQRVRGSYHLAPWCRLRSVLYTLVLAFVRGASIFFALCLCARIKEASCICGLLVCLLACLLACHSQLPSRLELCPAAAALLQCCWVSKTACACAHADRGLCCAGFAAGFAVECGQRLLRPAPVWFQAAFAARLGRNSRGSGVEGLLT